MSMKTVRMIALAAATTVLGATAIATTASAQTPDARISWSQLTSKLEQAGYHIRDLDQKHDGWEAEVTDKNNQRLELRLDRQGNITRQKIDD